MKSKKFITVALSCTMLLSMTGCSVSTPVEEDAQIEIVEEVQNTVESEVETAVGEFEYACQTSDVDAMLACLDPGVSQAMKSGRLLLNWMSSKKDSDEIIMNTMLIAVMNISDVTVDFSTMSIGIDSINVENDVAAVDATMTMDCSSGEYRDKVVIRMAKESDVWCITGVEN